MAIVLSPTTLESFAENRVKDLLEAQVANIPDSNILTGHTISEQGIDQTAPVIIVTVTREEEDIPGTGWWICTVEIELDPRDLDDETIDDISLKIETAIGDGAGDIETQLTNGRLNCMAGSVYFDQSFDYDPASTELSRFFKFTASFGLTSS
jgi:hypothetical protein